MFLKRYARRKARRHAAVGRILDHVESSMPDAAIESCSSVAALDPTCMQTFREGRIVGWRQAAGARAGDLRAGLGHSGHEASELSAPREPDGGRE